MKLKTLLQQAKEFRNAYNLTDTLECREHQKVLIDEEYSEFIEAHYRLDRVDCLKELADIVYVCYQYAANLHWDLDTAMDRVHESNMSKLGDDGKPVYRGDGKVLKGPNYKPPTLHDLI